MLANVRNAPLWLDRPPNFEPDSELPRETDLLVVGAGLTGLWAGIEASDRQVTVVDAGRIGGGASGRCGGFINASVTHGIVNGHARWPDEMATIVDIQERIWDDTLALLVDQGANVVVSCGKLAVATREHQLDGLGRSVEVLEAYGQQVRRLDRDELRAEVRSPTYVGGYHHLTANGLCDPVRLAETLAGVARARGATIAGEARVSALNNDGSAVSVRLADGRKVRAGKVLLATNAYRPLQRNLRRRVIPVYDHVIATAPLSAEQWASLGWAAGFGITDVGNQFHYYRPTPDGRVLFGGWDAAYHFGGRVDERFEHRPETHLMLASHLVETFPQLEGVDITHAWGGPIDSTSRFTATFGTAMGRKLGWAVGFTGLGVGASRFGALAALDLLDGTTTERTQLSMVTRRPVPFPPEPLRYPIIQLTKRALAREDRTGTRGPWLRFLDRIGVGFDT